MSLAPGDSKLFCHTSPFSSTCCLQPPFPSCSLRIAPSRRKKPTAAMALAYLQRDGNPCARRVVLVMGFAVIRLLKMRAHAIDDALPAGSTELAAPDQNQNAELSAQDRSGNPFFYILNVIGILGSGVLASLFALKKKEKASSDATVEYMKNIVKEKEAAIASMEKKFEEELIKEKELQNNVLGEVKAEQQSLVNQLEISTDTIRNLRQNLLKEQILVEELTSQVDKLEHCFQNAGDEKRQLQQLLKGKLDCVGVLQERIDLLSSEIKDQEGTIWHLSSKLSDNDRELNQLSSLYQQSEDHRTIVESENKQLKDILLKNQEELDLKNEMVHIEDSKLTTLLAEKDELNKKLDTISMEYHNFKSSMEKKLTSDAELLEVREGNIHLLEEQLELSLDDNKKNRVLISALTRERDNLKEMLTIELRKIKFLEEDLMITQSTLEKSRYETSDLDNQLLEARRLCRELEDEVAKVQAEFSEARESLQRKLDEAKQGSAILAEELSSTKDMLSISTEELQIMSTDLTAALQKCNSLEEELIDARKKAESITADMNEERKIVSSLNNELMNLEAQILKEKEARKSLEWELEQATYYLNELNQNATVLCEELELARSQISTLEDEKDELHKSIAVHKQASQKYQVNMEDAHNLVMRLGKERESLIKRGKKLEEDLAYAKGEILRLLSRIKSSKTAVNVKHVEKVNVQEQVAESSRRNTQRRRNANPHQQD